MGRLCTLGISVEGHEHMGLDVVGDAEWNCWPLLPVEKGDRETNYLSSRLEQHLLLPRQLTYAKNPRSLNFGTFINFVPGSR